MNKNSIKKINDLMESKMSLKECANPLQKQLKCIGYFHDPSVYWWGCKRANATIIHKRDNISYIIFLCLVFIEIKMKKSSNILFHCAMNACSIQLNFQLHILLPLTHIFVWDAMSEILPYRKKLIQSHLDVLIIINLLL